MKALAVDRTEADTQASGWIENFRGDKNLMGTVKENQEIRRFMAETQNISEQDDKYFTNNR